MSTPTARQRVLRPKPPAPEPAKFEAELINSVVDWIDKYGDRETCDDAFVRINLCRGKLGDFEIQRWSVADSTNATLDVWHCRRLVMKMTWDITGGGLGGDYDLELKLFVRGKWMAELFGLILRHGVYPEQLDATSLCGFVNSFYGENYQFAEPDNIGAINSCLVHDYFMHMGRAAAANDAAEVARLAQCVTNKLAGSRRRAKKKHRTPRRQQAAA
jgi:hypothetical protein